MKKYLLCLLFLVTLVKMSIASASCKAVAANQVNGMQCYDPNMFSGLTDKKKAMVSKFAPLALYLQQLTGYPASVLVANIAKEKGWVTKATGNNFYGISCLAKGGTTDSFAAPNGLLLTTHYSKCGNWQGFNNPQDSMIAYLHLILHSEHNFGGIRRAIPATFPPPASNATIVSAIANSGYCASGCKCQIGAKMASYGTCMNSHIKTACLGSLDNMVLCNYDYPILNGLKPLYKNIRPSASGGSATVIQYASGTSADGLETLVNQ